MEVIDKFLEKYTQTGDLKHLMRLKWALVAAEGCQTTEMDLLERIMFLHYK